MSPVGEKVKRQLKRSIIKHGLGVGHDLLDFAEAYLSDEDEENKDQSSRDTKPVSDTSQPNHNATIATMDPTKPKGNEKGKEPKDKI